MTIFERMLLTCPETAHLEEIEFEHTPLGMLVTGCSRFSPPCTVNCPRECAARLDRKARSQGRRDEPEDDEIDIDIDQLFDDDTELYAIGR